MCFSDSLSNFMVSLGLVWSTGLLAYAIPHIKFNFKAKTWLTFTARFHKWQSKLGIKGMGTNTSTRKCQLLLLSSRSTPATWIIFLFDSWVLSQPEQPQTVHGEIWFCNQWNCQNKKFLHFIVSLLQKYQEFPLSQEVIFWSVSGLCLLPCCQGKVGMAPTSNRYPDDHITEIWLHSGPIFSLSGERDPTHCEMFVQWGGWVRRPETARV